VIAILASWASYEEKVAAREDRRIARERAARQAGEQPVQGPGQGPEVARAVGADEVEGS
jgi:hypothetical protein